MKRSLALMLTTLALAGGLADAQRRSGGGFGGSRGSRYNAPRAPVPRYTPPANRYTTPSTTAPTTRTPSSAQRSTTGSAASAANRTAAARVSSSQLNAWRSARLPAGVPRSAITYSAAPTGQYRYQLSLGRYYPYPRSYYRSRGMGPDILRYALIFTAVSSVADALDGPDVLVNRPAPVEPQGPNLWTYAGVGFLAAAAGWFMLGRRRR